MMNEILRVTYLTKRDEMFEKGWNKEDKKKYVL